MSQPQRWTDAEVKEALRRIDGWEWKQGQISKQYQFPGFNEAMAFVNRVAALAEEAGHHPDISIRYNRVLLTLATHSAGGLTEKDFALAREIDRLPPATP